MARPSIRDRIRLVRISLLEQLEAPEAEPSMEAALTGPPRRSCRSARWRRKIGPAGQGHG